MGKWAVFDIDGTLVPGASLESRFLVHFRREIHIPYRSMLVYVMKGMAGFLSRHTSIREDAFKSNKMYLRGIPVQPVRDIAKRFFVEGVIPSLSARGLEEIKKFRRMDYKIMLLSGSLDILVHHFDDVCKPDRIICSELETANGRFTGRIIGLHPYSTKKRKILEGLKDELTIDFENSTVFANHHTDANHMELFGKIVAVNPTLELKDIAKKKGWRIEEWD